MLKSSVLLTSWEALTTEEIEEIRQHLREAIQGDYSSFTRQLEEALSQTIDVIRILPLYGPELLMISAADAMGALESYAESPSLEMPFTKYEIQVRFTNGDRVDGNFRVKAQALAFLSTFV